MKMVALWAAWHILTVLGAGITLPGINKWHDQWAVYWWLALDRASLIQLTMSTGQLRHHMDSHQHTMCGARCHIYTLSPPHLHAYTNLLHTHPDISTHLYTQFNTPNPTHLNAFLHIHPGTYTRLYTPFYTPIPAQLHVSIHLSTHMPLLIYTPILTFLHIHLGTTTFYTSLQLTIYTFIETMNRQSKPYYSYIVTYAPATVQHMLQLQWNRCTSYSTIQSAVAVQQMHRLQCNTCCSAV